VLGSADSVISSLCWVEVLSSAAVFSSTFSGSVPIYETNQISIRVMMNIAL